MDQSAEWVAENLAGVTDAIHDEFERLLADASTLSFRIAYAVLRQREDAEDVSQEACIRAYRSFRSLRDRQRFRSWLTRITWRLAIDRQRANRRRAVHEDSHARESSRTAAIDEADSRADALWQAIDTLPEKLRLTLVLAAIEGYDIAAIAALLNVPAGTIKSRLFAARARVREKLQCAK